MTINNYKAQEEICNYTISHYNTIKVKSGKLKWNYKCHNNSVHYASKNNHKKIAMCIYVEDGYPIIHFINYHKGIFVDNTLGEWSKNYTYYFVKWINKDEMWDVNTIFTAFRKELRKNLSWWIRTTSNFGA